MSQRKQVCVGVAIAATGVVLASCGHVVPSTTDASIPTATVSVVLPRYLDLGTSAPLQATIAGPALAAINYTWQVSPPGAATVTPVSASSAIDANGALTLTGMVTAGSAASGATVELAVAGDAVGSGSSSIEIAQFETFGYRAAFTQSSDTILNAGRALAIPVTMSTGQRVIAFGLHTGTAAQVRMGLYGSTGAAPGDLLLSSPVIAATIGETVSFLDTPQTITGQPSYLALVSATDLSISVDANAANAVTEFAADLAPGAALPSPFTQTTSFSGGPTNVFVIAIAP